MIDDELYTLAEAVGRALLSRGWTLSGAESCTGGWVSAAITAVPGSSAWFDRGFVTYSNEAKRELLGVRAETLARHGAVSEATVREMVVGVLARGCAQTAFAISGVAGPSGGTPDNPVGTVWFAWAVGHGAVTAKKCTFKGDRAAVRRQAVQAVLTGLLARLAA